MTLRFFRYMLLCLAILSTISCSEAFQDPFSGNYAIEKDGPTALRISKTGGIYTGEIMIHKNKWEKFSLRSATDKEASSLLGGIWKKSGQSALIADEGVFIAKLKPGTDLGGGIIITSGYFMFFSVMPMQLYKQ